MQAQPGQRIRRVAPVVLLLALAVLAGCSLTGSGAAERRAALDRWQDGADAACRKANAGIAKRGWPASLVELDRLAVRAIADVREASTAIRRMPAPEGSERRVAAFVGSLEGLEPLMDRLSSSTEDLRAGKLEAFAPRLQAALAAVEDEARRLGLRHCAVNDEHVWVPDAIRAPVFAQRLATLDREIVERVRAIGEPASTRESASLNFERLGDVIAFAERGLSRLKPPTWAAREAGRYVDGLRELGSALDAASTELGEPILTPVEAAAAQAELDRAVRLERRRFKRLAGAIRAVPVLPERGGDDGESLGGDEIQEA